MTQLTLSDLLAQETGRNLAAFFAHLREQGPLVHVADFGGMGSVWIATNYDDAIALLKDPRLTKDARKVLPPENGQSSDQGSPFLLLIRNMLTVDPPDHTRLRGLVSKAFTPRMIEQLRPRIQQITGELLDAVQERGAKPRGFCPHDLVGHVIHPHEKRYQAPNADCSQFPSGFGRRRPTFSLRRSSARSSVFPS
jgi:cytochrome P450